MWRSKVTIFYMFMIMVCCTSVLLAGERRMIDMREQKNLSPEAIGQALFPGSVPESSSGLTRGIPTSATTPKVENSVALDVLFQTNSATILPEYYDELNTFGKALTLPQFQTRRIQIEGHTDDVGSEPYNMTLSERRAKSISTYLVENFNIDPTRLVVKGMGETHPVVPNDSAQGRSKNRRVEVVGLTN